MICVTAKICKMRNGSVQMVMQYMPNDTFFFAAEHPILLFRIIKVSGKPLQKRRGV